jgi:uncharacterized protein YutE (UPF0331/DUF86 family)
MVDADTIRRRLRRLDVLVQQLGELAARPRDAFLADRVAQAAAERLLQVAIQIVLDVGAHVLADRGEVDWEEYRQIPRRLAEQGVVPEGVAVRLEKAAGQRNILVHMYLDVDPAIIFRTLHDDLGVFADFAAAVLRTLDAE